MSTDSTVIDRKFNIVAVNPVNGKLYTSENSLLLCAHDKAVPATLLAYHAECRELGSDHNHLASIALLRERVQKFQINNHSKVADTIGRELPRCLKGEDLHDLTAGVRILPVPAQLYNQVEQFVADLLRRGSGQEFESEETRG